MIYEKTIKNITFLLKMLYRKAFKYHMLNIPEKMLAKTVILKLNGNFALVVLPATYTISFKQFAKTVGLKKVELASEDEFQKLFSDCETGAMPPFGNLYDLPTYVSSDLKANKEIVFNAGSHVKLIKMKFSDYEKLVKPTIAHFELH